MVFLFVFLTLQFAREDENFKLKKRKDCWLPETIQRILSFLQARWTSFCCSVVLFAFIVLILLFCYALLHWEKVLDSSAFFSHPWLLACHHKCNYKKCYKKYLHGIKLQLFFVLCGMGKSVCGFSWGFLLVCLFSSPLNFEATSITWLKLFFILFKEKLRAFPYTGCNARNRWGLDFFLDSSVLFFQVCVFSSFLFSLNTECQTILE